jgi:ubiquinone/menaquinone biosynthesis C-methylase UbiE
LCQPASRGKGQWHCDDDRSLWPSADRGQRLLGAGCGAGEEARELARLVGPDEQVTAIDLSAGFIATSAE